MNPVLSHHTLLNLRSLVRAHEKRQIIVEADIDEDVFVLKDINGTRILSEPEEEWLQEFPQYVQGHWKTDTEVINLNNLPYSTEKIRLVQRSILRQPSMQTTLKELERLTKSQKVSFLKLNNLPSLPEDTSTRLRQLVPNIHALKVRAYPSTLSNGQLTHGINVTALDSKKKVIRHMNLSARASDSQIISALNIGTKRGGTELIEMIGACMETTTKEKIWHDFCHIFIV